MAIRILAGIAFTLLATGCGSKSPAAVADTGSHAVATDYFNAFLKKDWATAYAKLNPAIRKSCDLARFTRWAAAQRRRIGFEPDTVHIASCVESGSKAIAHVAFTGNRHHARFKDAVTLIQEEGNWFVALPADFDRRPR